MKKLKNNSGFSLIEMLAAMAVLVLLIVGMEGGMNAGIHAYGESIFQSNSGSLAGILNTALEDVLRYSANVKKNHGDDLKDASGATLDPSQVDCVFTNYEYGAVDTYFYPPEAGSSAPRKTLQFKSLQDKPEDGAREFINTGAYPNLAIKDFVVQYQEGKDYFDISYKIYDVYKPERVREVQLSVHILNPKG